MYIQRTRQANPYAAYQAMLAQRGPIGERGMALRAPEPQLARMSAPLIKQQMLEQAKRYERLGGMLSGILPTLGELARLERSPAATQVSAGKPVTPLETALPAMSAPGTSATLAGTLAIALNAGTSETAATMTSEAPRIRLDTGSAATAATLTHGKVALNTTQMTRAELRGDNLNIPKKAKEADFGDLTINGVTTHLGVFAGADERLGAQFIADRLNANQANTVTASVETNSKRVKLTSKVPGTAGNITIDQVNADSDGKKANDVSTGFRTGDGADGKDEGSTDFGSVTINGVTTSFGLLSNSQQSARSATSWLVERLNANTANDFTASVGGADQDQIVLTSKGLGSQGRLRIDQVTTDSDGSAQNAGSSGFVAGYSAQGQEAAPGMTDLGSVSINGVTTTFGVVSNDGLTLRGAASFMVERLNANSASSVVASLGGADQDRVVLTAKTPGSAGDFRIDRVSGDTDGRVDNDGFNGWAVGRQATGQDGGSGLTDFGSLTINGITTEFGVLDGTQHSAQTALQYLVDRLNQTNSTVSASAQDGKVLLRSRETGSGAALSIEAVAADTDGDAANDRSLGFDPGAVATGNDGGPRAGDQPAASGRAGTPAGGSPDEERLVPTAEVARMLGKTGQVVQYLNDYLKSLEDEGQDLPRSARGFRAQLLGTLGNEEETLSRLGIRMQDDRLEVDGAALEKALQEDPDAVSASFKQLQQGLEAHVGAQTFALDQMQAVAHTTSESATTISHVATSIFKLDHRAKHISWLMDQLKPTEATLRDQADRLKKLDEEKQTQRKEHEARQETARETAREKSPFGLLRSPVPEGFFQREDASRGLAPRWLDGR